MLVTKQRSQLAMGRPPIGKSAMSAAERMRRWRVRHGVTKHVTKRKSAETAPLGRDIERLKAKIAELEEQAANEAIVRSTLQERIAVLEKKRPMPRTAAELAQAKLRAEEERKALREARRAAARAAKPVEIPDDKTKEEYERQIKSLLTQLRNKRITIAKLVENIDMGKAMIFASAADRRFILAHFHPDRFKPDKKAQAERVFQLLNNMPVIDR